ncbi:MBL fold metallo-hydrolase [Sphingomonas oligophenolica]|uniref:MBL fold metallo-hydrolase n=1 Tax=Sphingomonas oligophenolica TaxID=301154 RepID=A0A502CGN6_9SPHN|nr:MBL fold metallo-hydrolase [Sphingomonas oligophenolica]TPG12138.1 MBL fold metallo-hydrolase [Sphingomonas oligophenolica]
MTTAFKIVGGALLLLIILFGLAVTIVPRFLDRIYYRGPVSDHFDGAHFFNPGGDQNTFRMPGGGSRAGFIWRYLTGNDGRPTWPERVPVTPSKPAPRVEGDRMVATWVGHATVLIQTHGLNILTDPVWSEKAGPFDLIGPRRVTAPGIRFDDLPPIDLVLVSHNHYDHLDKTTLAKLWKRDRPRIVTSLGNDSVIAQVGARATALDWGQRLAIRPGIDVVVTRNHHWGSRWGTDRNRALWSSFVVTFPTGGNLFFAGDTGLGDGQWPAEAAALGPIRLALIPIGAFRFAPGQMDSGSHIGPMNAVRVFARLDAAKAIPIHWGTFRLSYEAYDTPPKMLDTLMRCTGGDPASFTAATIGQPLDIAPYTAPKRPDEAKIAACMTTPEVTTLG